MSPKWDKGFEPGVIQHLQIRHTASLAHLNENWQHKNTVVLMNSPAGFLLKDTALVYIHSHDTQWHNHLIKTAPGSCWMQFVTILAPN